MKKIADGADAEIARGAFLLRAGHVVAFPTETVYGLGADAANGAAVRTIFDLKGRPHDHPLIVHLPGIDHLDRWAREIPPEAFRLAERFWPGPFTLVLRRGALTGDVITGGQDTVALRIPAHPLALALLRAFGGGVAAPSANRFGRVSPTTARHVVEEFGDALELVLDGGPCTVGVESTILSLAGAEPLLLRPGGIARADLEEVLGRPIHRGAAGTAIRAPGMLEAHYAPSTPLRVIPAGELHAEALRQTGSARRVATMLISEPPAEPPPGCPIVMPATPEAYARRLYATLRSLDRGGYDLLLAEAPPEREEWSAVNDRLLRASVGSK